MYREGALCLARPLLFFVYFTSYYNLLSACFGIARLDGSFAEGISAEVISGEMLCYVVLQAKCSVPQYVFHLIYTG